MTENYNPTPPAQNPSQAPPAPKAKKKKKWPWIVGIVVVLSLIGGIGNAINGEEKAAVAAAEASASAEAKAQEEAEQEAEVKAEAERKAAEEEAEKEAEEERKKEEAAAERKAKAAVEFKEEYDSIGDLVTDFEAAGGDCSGWSQENNVTLALESGTCDDDTVISTYISSSEITELMEMQKALFESLEMSGDSSWLIGDKWIINTSEDELAVISQFGGKEVRF